MKKIIILDDDRAMCALIEKFLEKEYQVFKASVAEEAIKIILNEKPDLLLLDVVMPQISGYAFQKILRESRSKVGDLGVIAISARESMKDYFEPSDIYAFLAKPFTKEVLCELVARYFHEKAPAKNHAAPSASLLPKERAVSSDDKWVLLVTPDDAVVRVLKKYFDSLGYRVEVALDEKDFLRQAARLRCSLAICQFWETADVLDAADIYKKFKAMPEVRDTPLVVICIPGMAIEASKLVQRDSIVSFSTMDELCQELSRFCPVC